MYVNLDGEAVDGLINQSSHSSSRDGGDAWGCRQVAESGPYTYVWRIAMKGSRRGFTLVEILIVVIILGILAAIVIPQFTNASNDARNNSTASTLQTIRSQIELFKIQHADTPPASAGCLWAVLGGRTSPADTTGTDAAATATFGPYV